MYKQIASNKRKTVLLIGAFIVLILACGWAFSELSEMGYIGLAVAVVISLAMSIASYYSGDKVALWTAGAKPISKEENPYVYRLVENLCITAGLPMPKIHIIDDPAMNAFATGRDPEHASIALTSGIIENLENEELEGVIAHELSHIKNYDIRLMMVVVVLVGIIVLMTDFFLRWSFLGGRRSRDKSGGQAGQILLIVGLVLMILSPILGKIIQLAISRKREFLADASGSLLTRYPDGLASALEKITRQGRPLRKTSNATAHLYIASPFAGKKRFMSKLFATHPPVEERIRALKEMA